MSLIYSSSLRYVSETFGPPFMVFELLPKKRVFVKIFNSPLTSDGKGLIREVKTAKDASTTKIDILHLFYVHMFSYTLYNSHINRTSWVLMCDE